MKMALFEGNANHEEIAGITILTDITPTVGKEMMVFFSFFIIPITLVILILLSSGNRPSLYKLGSRR